MYGVVLEMNCGPRIISQFSNMVTGLCFITLNSGSHIHARMGSSWAVNKRRTYDTPAVPPRQTHSLWLSMPRFALAKKLSHGCSPEEFCNLMWIEARRVYTTHLDPAAVLLALWITRSAPTFGISRKCPRARGGRESDCVGGSLSTPDVNSLLSVFTGPSGTKLEYFGNTQKTCKSKVWGFLQSLKVHDGLYRDNLSDEQMMDHHP